jgi:hypothetical protein
MSNFKKITAVLFLVVISVLALAACGKSNTDSAPTAFFDEENPEASRVVGANSATEATDLMIDKINKTFDDNKFVAVKSSELPLSDTSDAGEPGSEYVVVSVVCAENVPADDIGPYNSDALFSVLKREGDTWTFVRLPDEAIDSVENRRAFPREDEELPQIINNSEALTAGFELGEELSKSTPKECQQLN